MSFDPNLARHYLAPEIANSLPNLFSDHIRHWLAIYRREMVANNIDTLIIDAGRIEIQYLDDLFYPFYANPHFKLFCKDVSPGSFLVIGETSVKLVWHTPADFWHKVVPLGEPDWASAFDTQEVPDDKRALKSAIESASQVAIIGRDHALYEDFGIAKSHIDPEKFLAAVHFERAYKTDYELHCLYAANRRALKGHEAVRELFEAGASEYALHMEYLSATVQEEWACPYTNIIALNENSAMLHYHGREHVAPEMRSLLIDAGATCQHYCSDITRTYARDKSSFFAELIERLTITQQNCVKSIKTETPYLALHEAMHRDIAGILHETKLVDLSADAQIESGVTKTFFPHGLGHFLGLQVHDMGGTQKDPSGTAAKPPAEHASLRNTRVVQPRQVFTIEPGLYFIPMLLNDAKSASYGKHLNWDLIEKCLPYGGIRIEDNIAIRQDGSVWNLTLD